MDRTTNKEVVLKGMAMMGGEYMCVHGNGIFAGPANESVIRGMASWGINALRLPMNEDCWLGHPDLNPAFSGAAYRDTFVKFVEVALNYGFVVVLDLHWTNTTTGVARGQDPFLSPNSLKFWASVAGHPSLRNRPGVVFELFNEPFNPRNATPLTPECYLDGAGCVYAGYNQAVRAVRSTANASNLVLFAGTNWNFDLGWLAAHFPTDPLGNCAAAWHPYEFKCRYFSCENTSAVITAKYPIFVTEWAPGYPQSNHSPSVPDLYTSQVMGWADKQPATVALFPWVWNPGAGQNHVTQPDSDYSGNLPNAWGHQYKAWSPKRYFL